MNKNFVHFKIHSQFSICEGAIKIDNLKDHCKINKFKSLGICDTSNLSGALEFSETISKQGTQPIIGTQIIEVQLRMGDIDRFGDPTIMQGIYDLYNENDTEYLEYSDYDNKFFLSLSPSGPNSGISNFVSLNKNLFILCILETYILGKIKIFFLQIFSRYKLETISSK